MKCKCCNGKGYIETGKWLKESGDENYVHD